MLEQEYSIEMEKIVIAEESEAKGVAKGKTEGEAIGKAKVAEKMLKAKKPIDEIIEFTGLPKKDIEKLSRSINGDVAILNSFN